MENERYSVQEMKLQGFPFYEIIDTKNGCNTIFYSFSYLETQSKFNELERELLNK